MRQFSLAELKANMAAAPTPYVPAPAPVAKPLPVPASGLKPPRSGKAAGAMAMVTASRLASIP